MGSCCCWH